MAQGIEFNFLANTRDVVKGAGDASDALEEVADALDDIGKADGADDIDFREVVRRANDAGEKIEESFEDAASRSERELQGIEGAMRDVEQTARTSGGRAGQALDDGMSAGAARAKEEVAELKNEAVQNLSETASSFDGSFQSIADGVQGTLGGVVSSLGPVGAAIGLAGAVGLGIVMAEQEKAQEAAQETRERTGEITDALIDAGDRGGRGAERVAEGLRDLATEAEEGAISLTDIAELARDVDGLDFQGLTRALAGGDVSQMRDQLGIIEETIAAREEEIRLANSAATEYSELQAMAQIANDEQLSSANAYRDELLVEIEAMEQAQAAHEAWVAAGGELWQQQADAATEAGESIQEALLDAGGAYEDFIDEESGIFDTSAYLAAFEERAAAVTAYQANMRTASQTLNAQALSYIQTLGVDAAPMLQAYINAPLDEQQRLEQVWAQLGDAATDSYVTQLGNNMPTSIEGPAVVLRIDDTAVRRYKPPLLPSATVPVQIARPGVPVVT